MCEHNPSMLLLHDESQRSEDQPSSVFYSVVWKIIMDDIIISIENHDADEGKNDDEVMY